MLSCFFFQTFGYVEVNQPSVMQDHSLVSPLTCRLDDGERPLISPIPKDSGQLCLRSVAEVLL